MNKKYLFPDWPVNKRVKAFSTKRFGGLSIGDYHSFNLSLKTGDKQDSVLANRRQVQEDFSWQIQPQWLQLVHGNKVVKALSSDDYIEADAIWSNNNHQVCSVLTADCLPVLFCDKNGLSVAASHAGWRGLQSGVLENTIQAMPHKASDIFAWLGPAISKKHFEVGDEVRSQFMEVDERLADAFILKNGRWMADLYLIAKKRLQSIGVENIYGGQWCTYDDPKNWYSYRRDGKATGRFLSAIWLESDLT